MAVRRESVRLELVDNFTTPMARAAAATALLDKNLNSLSGSSVESARGVRDVGDEADKTSVKTRRAAADINQFSGRLRLLTEAAVTLGPALIPLGAAAVPAITALTAGLGAAAGAVGTLVLAFDGMGDALSAINDYQLEPTTANLVAMQDALSEVGPAGRDFAQFLVDLKPALDDLQNVARAGLFPGLQEGIENLLPLLPQVERIISEIATSLGDLGADAGDALASDRFKDFFDYIESDAAPTLEAFARSTGNVIEGLSSLLVAFAPLNRDFTAGMESMTRSFAEWAAELSETESFREFVDYIRESGPQVLDLLGSLAGAFVAIIRAAAPFGQAVVPALTALADVFAAIANSPVGPPLFTAAAGLLAVSRASTIAAAGMARFNAAAAGGGLGKIGLAGRVAGIAAAFSILGNELAKLNGSKVNLSELGGDLDAIAAGGGADALDHIAESFKMLNEAGPDAFEIPTFGGLFGNTPRDNAAEYIRSVSQELATMVASGNADKASEAFNEIAAAITGLPEGSSFDPSFIEGFDTYSDAVAAATGATSEYATANGEAASSAAATRTEIRGLVAAMQEQTNAALGAFDAVTQYNRALDTAQAQAKRSAAGIDAATEAGRKNRDALTGLAAAYNGQSDAVKNNVGKWREARQAFIDTAAGMGVAEGKAKKLADRLMEIPKSRVAKVGVEGADEATDRVERLSAALSRIVSKTITVTANTVSNGLNSLWGSADGGTVPGSRYPYRDKVLAYLAPTEEVITNRNGEADRFRADRAAGRIPAYADGGTVGARHSLDDQVAIAQAIQQIMDLRRSLAKDGKDKLEGINRRIAELELRRATKELRLTETRERREARSALRAAGAGLSFDSLLPSDPQTVAQGVGSAIAEFQREVEAAGGEWTRELRQWARDMRVTAREYDATQAAIEAETERREALVDTLDEQQSQLDDLNRTMAAFGASVAANFLNDGFNQSRTVTGATSPAVAQMQAQLAAIQAGSGAGAGAQASRLMQQIALLQPGETTLTGLDALRDTLSTDTADATAFTAALRQLVSQGLDPLSGFYSELATSGDLLTAQQLVAAGPGGIDELEALWQQRDAATAELAAMTTQAVYGEQQAALVALIAQTNAAIAASDATLVVLNAELLILGEQVRAGSEAGAALLQPQLEDIEQAINALPRNLQALIRQAGGR